MINHDSKFNFQLKKPLATSSYLLIRFSSFGQNTRDEQTGIAVSRRLIPHGKNALRFFVLAYFFSFHALQKFIYIFTRSYICL